MMYQKCPDCGANNDPGEVCDCKKRPEEKRKSAQGVGTPQGAACEKSHNTSQLQYTIRKL